MHYKHVDSPFLHGCGLLGVLGLTEKCGEGCLGFSRVVLVEGVEGPVLWGAGHGLEVVHVADRLAWGQWWDAWSCELPHTCQSLQQQRPLVAHTGQHDAPSYPSGAWGSGEPRTAHARTTNQPTELHPSTCLEVAARYEQVYLLALCFLQVLQGAVDVIQFPMAAAFYGDLFAHRIG